MGCDIHLHIEVKVDGKWEHYGHPNVDRNYDLFTKLAGVRDRGNEVEPISPPRGLPEDCSAVTKKSAESWGNDAHSHSWIGPEEIVMLSAWLETLPYKGRFGGSVDLEWDILHCYLERNSFAGFSKYPEERPEWIQDLRFVFWFDN